MVMLCESYIVIHKETNKIDFAFLCFFYDFL
jgi:hypothetical protein